MNKQETSPWRLEDFHILCRLYSGKASSVFKADIISNGQPVILKLYRKSRLSELNKFQVAREVRLHIHLSHKHIIKMYGAFEDGKYVYLVLERASGGDLYEHFKRSGSIFSEHYVAAQILQPYLLALAYLHGQGIVHRDIKPENLFLQGPSLVLKVGDFGLSINQDEERPVTRAGTLDYMSPEVLRCPDKRLPQDQKERADLWYSEKADVWAAGVLAFEMLIGHAPFQAGDKHAQQQLIFSHHPKLPSWLSDLSGNFIKQCLQKDAKLRPSVTQLLRHPWILQFQRTASFQEASVNLLPTPAQSTQAPRT